MLSYGIWKLDYHVVIHDNMMMYLKCSTSNDVVLNIKTTMIFMIKQLFDDHVLIQIDGKKCRVPRIIPLDTMILLSLKKYSLGPLLATIVL